MLPTCAILYRTYIYTLQYATDIIRSIRITYTVRHTLYVIQCTSYTPQNIPVHTIMMLYLNHARTFHKQCIQEVPKPIT